MRAKKRLERAAELHGGLAELVEEFEDNNFDKTLVRMPLDPEDEAIEVDWGDTSFSP